MRCPYCGGFNADQANFCARCGRDLKPYPPPNQPRQAYPPPSQGRPTTLPQSPQQQQAQQPPVMQRRRNPAIPPQPVQDTLLQGAPVVPVVPAKPPAPEPPAEFPPRTVEQLRALEEGAQAYTVVHSAVGDGRKKIVKIAYPGGAGWQQVATLYKALKEQLEDGFDTIIIQGVFEQNTGAYEFTNGQLVFDRGVRLGGLILNRYQIETGNGFDADSVRIVLTE